MGMVKYEAKFRFPEGDVWVLWDAGESNEYGYEIDVTAEEGHGGNLVGIANWSFGYEDWSRDVWLNWGEYVAKRLEEIEGDENAFSALCDELDNIDCNYESYQPDDKYRREHLVDLNTIEKLIEENKYKWTPVLQGGNEE